MIAVNKAEKEAVLKRFPRTQFVRTMKQDSKRHHYYMVEEREPVRYVRQMRGLEPMRGKNGGKRYHNDRRDRI